MSYQRLLLKIKAHGIGDGLTDWIEQWLFDKRQRVVVDGEVSNWKTVLNGVPHGSVLGPLLYINDIDVNYEMGHTVLGTNVIKGIRSHDKCWYESLKAVWHCSGKG